MLVTMSFLSTLAVFGTIGFLVSKKFQRPVKTGTWITLGVAAILSGWILPRAYLISGGDFTITISNALVVFFLGILAGLTQRELKLKVH